MTGPTVANGLIFATRGLRGAAVRREAASRRASCRFRDIAWNYERRHARHLLPGRLERPAVHHHRRRHRPLPRRRQRQPEMERAAQGAIQSLAASPPTAAFLPEYRRPVHGRFRLAAVRQAGREPARRPDARLARHSDGRSLSAATNRCTALADNLTWARQVPAATSLYFANQFRISP